MTLGAPPPRRSRRERIRLPGRRLQIALGVLAAALVVAFVWHPWREPPRGEWTTAPVVPATLSPAERAWQARIARWAAFVDDAREDPAWQAVQRCGERLDAVGEAPASLRELRELADDTCAALTASARHRVSATRSLDPALLDRAAKEEREGNNDLALLVDAVGARRDDALDARLSKVASRVAGAEVTVRCFSSLEDWRAVQRVVGRTEEGVQELAGFAVFAERRAELSPEVCRTLKSIRTASHSDATDAIAVLTHEAQHLAGVDGIEDEATTDCYSAQRMRQTAVLLGRPPAEAASMGALYLRTMQPLLPEQYRSPDCRNGGGLDLRPRDPEFP